MVNGKEIASVRIPSGTQGMPGFLVNHLKDCVVKVRNIKIKFLHPAKKQLEEFEKHPLFNWLKYKKTTKKEMRLLQIPEIKSLTTRGDIAIFWLYEIRD